MNNDPPEMSELIGIMATRTIGELAEAVVKLQAEVTMEDLIGTEFENPDFLGGMVYVVRVMQRLTMHALAAAPSMKMELGSTELAGFLGSLLVLLVGELEEQVGDKPLHVPDKGVSVVAWGDIGGR